VRIVLDTNVLLAALGTRGLCEALLTASLEAHDLFVSEHILDELSHHLVETFRLSSGRAEERVLFVRQQMTLVEPTPTRLKACRDPADLPVLGTAHAARADVLVTGDKDLLVLKRHRGTEIVTPRACYELLAGRPSR
jgi:uncharacterized protein